jgi:hypothetical protein
MWMGGTPPNGYDLKDRQLVVNEAEAETVRLIYRRYLELGCVRALADDLKARGVVSKITVSRRGHHHGGQPYGRGALYHLLQNRLYLGEIVHNGQTYAGQHAGIVSRNLWDRVQTALQTNRIERKPAKGLGRAALLTGLLRDDLDNLMVPTQTHKANGQRYRYYVSQALTRGGQAGDGGGRRVSAAAVEMLVEGEVRRRFPTSRQATWLSLAPAERVQKVRTLIAAVSLKESEIEIALTDEGARTLSLRANRGKAASIRVPTRLSSGAGGTTITPRDVSVAPGGRLDRALVRAIVRAHHWRERLEVEEARSAYDLARQEGCRVSYVQRHLPLAFLAPALVEEFLDGRQPTGCSLSGLLENPAGLIWP